MAWIVPYAIVLLDNSRLYWISLSTVDIEDGPIDPTGRPIPPERHVFHGILRVADVFTRGLSEVLRPFNLSLSQYNVLQALRHTESGGLGCREVGAQLVSRDPDVTRLLDRLEARGLISRRRERPDRRVVRTQITEEGLELLKTVDELVAKLHARHLNHLGLQELSTFNALLRSTEGRS
jgi:DNA-binding MarR family transcriptional regulator